MQYILSEFYTFFSSLISQRVCMLFIFKMDLLNLDLPKTLLMLLFFLRGVCFQEIKNKICIEKYDRDACQQIGRSGEFVCTETTVSIADCFLNIDQNLPQIAFVKPEDALLAAPLVSDKVVVIGEVIPANLPYATVVLVRSPFSEGFNNLKEKRLCHPGFKHDELVTRYVLEELESKVLGLNSSFCNADKITTVLEKRMAALANFFGDSCRPGKWSDHDELDAYLKKKYSSLCALCGSEKCDVTYEVPFNDSLTCLTEKGGDVAITTLNDATAFFSNPSNARNFVYLCSNGSVIEHSSVSTPCTWTKQFNRLIVAGNDSVELMTNFVKISLPDILLNKTESQTPLPEVYVAALKTVLDLDSTDKISLTEPTSLNSFVKAGRIIPSAADVSSCDLTVKWCTRTTSEETKCQWLAQASLNSGLLPPIQCVQSRDADNLSCLNDIRDGKADISFVDVNYGYIALKKGLQNIAYIETDTRKLSTILIVTRADANVTRISNLSGLKGKRACFPEYGGKEWLAFVDTFRQQYILEDSCLYSKIFNDFVGLSCVPGARSNDYEIGTDYSDKLCSQCIPINNTLTASYCSADDGNKYYGSDGALRCLSSGDGDYAVVTKIDVTEASNPNDFRVLCKNGTLSEFTGFKVDENAALTVLVAGEVVSKANSSKSDDIVLLLRGIEIEFGQNLRKSFKLFESFDNKKDLLFPDSTPGLTFGGRTIKYVENFKTILTNSEKCINEVVSKAAVSFPSSLVLLIILLLKFIN